MKYDVKEYYEQDESCKGPMRRRYDDDGTNYKGYIIYRYIRGEWTRYGVEDEKENLICETDNLQELKEYIDNLKKEE